MQLLLTAAEASLPAHSADDIALSPAEKRALVSLGYAADLQRDGKEPPGQSLPEQSLPDIKDRIEWHDRLEQANRLLDEDRPERPSCAFARSPRRSPKISRRACFWVRRWRERESSMKHSMSSRSLSRASPIEGNPRDADLHYNLGVVLAQQGQFVRALSQLKQALQLDPGHPKAGAHLERVEVGLAPK